jgi:hypothetical protein
MSPRISNVPFIDPIQAARFSTAVGGMTSATGLPNRVIRIRFFVERTRSSIASRAKKKGIPTIRDALQCLTFFRARRYTPGGFSFFFSSSSFFLSGAGLGC